MSLTSYDAGVHTLRAMGLRSMQRRTVSLPEGVDALIRELARPGESYSATVVRLVEEGARATRGKKPPSFIGIADGERTVACMTIGLIRRAVSIDARFADLDLGLVDASVMALADRERAPIFTFDFADFRAAPRPDGTAWPLVVDEASFARLTAGGAARSVLGQDLVDALAGVRGDLGHRVELVGATRSGHQHRGGS